MTLNNFKSRIRCESENRKRSKNSRHLESTKGSHADGFSEFGECAIYIRRPAMQLRIVKVTRAGRDTVSIVGVDTH